MIFIAFHFAGWISIISLEATHIVQKKRKNCAHNCKAKQRDKNARNLVQPIKRGKRGENISKNNNFQSFKRCQKTLHACIEQEGHTSLTSCSGKIFYSFMEDYGNHCATSERWAIKLWLHLQIKNLNLCAFMRSDGKD